MSNPLAPEDRLRGLDRQGLLTLVRLAEEEASRRVCTAAARVNSLHLNCRLEAGHPGPHEVFSEATPHGSYNTRVQTVVQWRDEDFPSGDCTLLENRVPHLPHEWAPRGTSLWCTGLEATRPGPECGPECSEMHTEVHPCAIARRRTEAAR